MDEYLIGYIISEMSSRSDDDPVSYELAQLIIRASWELADLKGIREDTYKAWHEIAHYKHLKKVEDSEW